jgi:two-component system response regulator GlrR
LRVLQEREVRPLGATRAEKVDVRVISATNRDLDRRLRDGRFREDLFYRLNVIHVHIPPLRDRAEDVPRLVHHYLAVIAGRERRPVPRVTPAALDKLAGYAWPGNVRELVNLAEGGNKTRAAQRLGLDRKTLYRKLEEYAATAGDVGPPEDE